MISDLITSSDLCELWDISKQRLAQLRDQSPGGVPYVKKGLTYLYSESMLRKLYPHRFMIGEARRKARESQGFIGL